MNLVEIYCFNFHFGSHSIRGHPYVCSEGGEVVQLKAYWLVWGSGGGSSGGAYVHQFFHRFVTKKSNTFPKFSIPISPVLSKLTGPYRAQLGPDSLLGRWGGPPPQEAKAKSVQGESLKLRNLSVSTLWIGWPLIRHPWDLNFAFSAKILIRRIIIEIFP